MADDHHSEQGEDKEASRPTPPQASAKRRPEIDEDAVLREGRDARRQLGQRMARAALNDPRALTAKRLQRLGPEGLQRFVAELRSELGDEPQSASTRSVSAPTNSTAKPATPAGQSKAGGAAGGGGRSPPPRPSAQGAFPEPPRPNDATAFQGWWLTCREGRWRFEVKAVLYGLLVGTTTLLLSLGLLALTRL